MIVVMTSILLIMAFGVIFCKFIFFVKKPKFLWKLLEDNCARESFKSTDDCNKEHNNEDVRKTPKLLDVANFHHEWDKKPSNLQMYVDESNAEALDVDFAAGKFFKHLDTGSTELSGEIDREELKRFVLSDPDASIFYQKSIDKSIYKVTNDGVGIYLSSVGGGDDHEHKQDEAKDRCISVGESVVDSWTKEPSEKTEVLKPKPKQRARKLRKNKKTQGKS